MYGIQYHDPLRNPASPNTKIQFHTGVAQQTGWFINYKVAVEGNNVNLTELLYRRKI